MASWLDVWISFQFPFIGLVKVLVVIIAPKHVNIRMSGHARVSVLRQNDISLENYSVEIYHVIISDFPLSTQKFTIYNNNFHIH